MKIKLIIGIWIGLLISLTSVFAAASFQVTGFSCSPSEVAVNSQFSCTATVSNVGDASGSVAVATLYPDDSNWLENSNYPQASGSSVGAGQSTSITFSGLKAVKAGSGNSFSKIMLDSLADNYASDTQVNTIDIAISTSNSVSSAAMGGSFVVTADITAGGNIDVVLAFAASSGGCSTESTNPITINGLSHGSQQSRSWTVIQGTSGNCRYSVSAAATGSDGKATKTNSVTSSVTCSDCPTNSGSTTGPGGGSGTGGAGGVTNVFSLEEIGVNYLIELSDYEKVKLNFSGIEHYLTLENRTETHATILIESEKQRFTLAVSDEIRVDLNKDNIFDISVKLKSINLLLHKASLVITRISEYGGVSGQTSGEQASSAGNEGSERGESGANNGKTNFLTNKTTLYILIVSFIILAAISLSYYIKRKKRNFAWGGKI